MKHTGMRERARNTLIDRVEQATGRTDCTEVVVLQQRERWVMPVVAAVVVAALGLANLLFDPNGIVRGIIVGLAVAVPLTFLMTGHWLASCGDSIVLVQVAKLASGEHKIVGEWRYPVSASIDGGLVTKRVTLDGQSFILAPQFIDRFRAITGTT